MALQRDWIVIGDSLPAWSLQGSGTSGSNSAIHLGQTLKPSAASGTVPTPASDVKTSGPRNLGANKEEILQYNGDAADTFFAGGPPILTSYYPTYYLLNLWADWAPIGAQNYYDPTPAAGSYGKCVQRDTTRGMGTGGYSRYGLLYDRLLGLGEFAGDDPLIDAADIDPDTDLHWFAYDSGVLSNWTDNGVVYPTRFTSAGFQTTTTDPDRTIASVDDALGPASYDPSLIAGTGFFGRNSGYYGCKFCSGDPTDEFDYSLGAHNHSLAELLSTAGKPKTVIIAMGGNNMLANLKLWKRSSDNKLGVRVITHPYHLLDNVPDSTYGDDTITRFDRFGNDYTYETTYEGLYNCWIDGIGDFVAEHLLILNQMIDDIYGFATWNGNNTEADVEVMLLTYPNWQVCDDRGGDFSGGSYSPYRGGLDLPHNLPIEVDYDAAVGYAQGDTSPAFTSISLRGCFKEEGSQEGSWNPTSLTVTDADSPSMTTKPMGDSIAYNDTNGPFHIPSSAVGDGAMDRERTHFNQGIYGLIGYTGQDYLYALAFRRWRALWYADTGRATNGTSPSSHTGGTEQENWEATYDDHMSLTNFFYLSGDFDDFNKLEWRFVNNLHTNYWVNLTWHKTWHSLQNNVLAIQGPGGYGRKVFKLDAWQNGVDTADDGTGAGSGVLGAKQTRAFDGWHTLDGLHPNMFGSRIWVQGFVEQLAEYSTVALTDKTAPPNVNLNLTAG